MKRINKKDLANKIYASWINEISSYDEHLIDQVGIKQYDSMTYTDKKSIYHRIDQLKQKLIKIIMEDEL